MNPRTKEVAESTAWLHLENDTTIGRLAVVTNGVPEIFPVNFAVDGRTIVFRTTVGTKLHELTLYSSVVFEADRWEEKAGWSVIVHGEARVFDDDAEIQRAGELLEIPWQTDVEAEFVRIIPSEITCRSTNFGTEHWEGETPTWWR
ncbi:pyridoxamine 5'-phosphate oxidase family protein [Propionibacterium sp.]|uniref:pyridoxamine 5'-phosphate oxidase family protein n=1 Tax=Propionibacterium sp. TaxID=1977903 RepID=UPI0039E87592